MKNIFLRLLFSCDYAKGLLFNFEGFCLSSRLTLLKGVGEILATKNKKRRLDIIEEYDNPLISIILPAYNSESTIEATIESIVNQAYSSWELLVIDDGSTDATLEKITKISKKDSRIKSYKNGVNKGVAYTRNIGLFYSVGDYITFHDADDTSHPERLECQIAELLFNPSLEVVVCQYVRVNKQKEPFIINGRNKWNYVSGRMVKKGLVNKIGYYKPLKISEDSEYYERILAVYGKKSRKIICKTLYYALFSPDSLLFSNANLSINGKSINYKIHNEDYLQLQDLRRDHKLITKGELSPYQSFSPDKEGQYD